MSTYTPCPDCGRRIGWDGHAYSPCGKPARRLRRRVACTHCTDGVDRNGNICTYCAGDGEPR